MRRTLWPSARANYFIVTDDCICVLTVQVHSTSSTFAYVESSYMIFYNWFTKFGMCGGVADVINHAKFHANRYTGFGFLRVEICLFPILSAMAYTTGWGYCPTRDRFRDTALRSRKPHHPILSSRIAVTLSNFVVKLIMVKVQLLFAEKAWSWLLELRSCVPATGIASGQKWTRFVGLNFKITWFLFVIVHTASQLFSNWWRWNSSTAVRSCGFSVVAYLQT